MADTRSHAAEEGGTMAERVLGLERGEWRFWLLWVLASVAGCAMAVGGGAVASGGDVDPLVSVAVAGASGSVVGALQWLVLRKRIRRPGWVVDRAKVGDSHGW